MKIKASKTITDKQGYEAMLYMLEIVLDRTGSVDITDILSGGEYMVEDSPSDHAYWIYWQEALDKLERDGPPPLKKFI